jgi:predicted porin
MKRTILSLAAMALAGAASAQSSVQLYGVMDSVLAHGRGSGAAGNRVTALASGGMQSSRIGFRGIEDLGGGLSAGFVLESQVFIDSGLGQATNTNNQASGGALAGMGGSQGLTFARRSTVSVLSKQWGELRLGRDFTSQYRNRLEIDPFGNAGVGSSQAFIGSLGGPVTTRASNIVGYFLPENLGGFYGQAQYYLGENASDSPAKDAGTGYSARLGYVWGDLNVSLAGSHTDYAAAPTTGDIESLNLGVQYQLGQVRLLGGLYQDKVKRSTGTLTGKGWAAAGIWKVGPGEVKFSLSEFGTDATNEPKTRKLAVGYVHYLSKRTALYTTVAKVRNYGGAATSLNQSTTSPNGSSSGVDLGIRHTF